MADLDPVILALINQREARDWSRRKVAETARLSSGTVSLVELGKSGITLASLRMWAQALDCDLALVTPQTEPPKGRLT